LARFQPLSGSACFCANAADIRVASPRETAQAQRVDKLQRAGRDFLMQLVAKHGVEGAARVLRALADERDGLPGLAIQAPPLRKQLGTSN
jgi:predicted HAD superfamily phosphohydrolase